MIICRRRGRYRDTLPYIIIVVEQPDLEHSRDYLDFGKGFYLTSIRHQAVLYSERFFLRGRRAFLGEYDLSDAYIDLNIKTFDAYDEEWLDFVFQFRKGEDKSEYDIVIGGIADDKIFKTIDLLTFISAEEITK